MRRFDEKELLERVDNDRDFLADTVQTLETGGRALVDEIRLAATTRNALTLGRAAHAIQGMASNFRSPATHASAAAVERIARGDGDPAAASVAVDELGARPEELIAGMAEFLATRARCAS